MNTLCCFCLAYGTVVFIVVVIIVLSMLLLLSMLFLLLRLIVNIHTYIYKRPNVSSVFYCFRFVVTVIDIILLFGLLSLLLLLTTSCLFFTSLGSS